MKVLILGVLAGIILGATFPIREPLFVALFALLPFTLGAYFIQREENRRS